MFEKLLKATRDLSLTNVLILALILLIAAPAYFAYRFMMDEDFRREFMHTASILDKHVPCVVLAGQRFGNRERYTILMVYGLEGRSEKIIGLRTPGTLNDTEIEETCKRVLAMADEIKAK
jgi:hypothetical protein